MPKIVSAKKRAINIRLPDQLLAEVDALLMEGTTPYSDRTDFIKCALRKELEYQQKKKEGLLIQSGP